MLTKLGHEAWTAYQAGVSEQADDELSVYASDRGAVLLTHDREFSQRRRRNVYGRHVWLNCPELDAIVVLEAALPALLPILEHNRDVWVRLTPTRLELSYLWR